MNIDEKIIETILNYITSYTDADSLFRDQYYMTRQIKKVILDEIEKTPLCDECSEAVHIKDIRKLLGDK